MTTERVKLDLEVLRELLNELHHLRKQRDELQADNTRLVLENRRLRGEV